MQAYTHPVHGNRIVPMERRRLYAVVSTEIRPGKGSILGRVSMDRDEFGLYLGETDDDTFRSASIAHAIDHIVRVAAFA